MKKTLIEYMKRHFDWTYNYNYCNYTFSVNDYTSRAFRIEPFLKKYFNSQWEILANHIYVTCNYYDAELH